MRSKPTIKKIPLADWNGQGESFWMRFCARGAASALQIRYGNNRAV
jgi:hypothetical protein